MSSRASGDADAAGDGDTAADGGGSALGEAVGDTGLDVGPVVEAGATAIALGDGPSLPHPAITTRPAMDRLVRVRFMALAPTAVRRLSYTRIEACRRRKVSPRPRRPAILGRWRTWRTD